MTLYEQARMNTPEITSPLSLREKIDLFQDMRSSGVPFKAQDNPSDMLTVVALQKFKTKNAYWNNINPVHIGWVSLAQPKTMLYPTKAATFGELPGLAVFSIDPLQRNPVTVVPALTFAEVCQSFQDIGSKPGILSFTAIATALGAQIMVIQPQYSSEYHPDILDADLNIPEAEVVQIVLDTFSYYGPETHQKIERLANLNNNPNVAVVMSDKGTVIKVPKKLIYSSLAYTGSEDFQPVTVYTPLKQSGSSMMVGMDMSSILDDKAKAVDFEKVKSWFIYTQGQMGYDEAILSLHRANPDQSPSVHFLAQLRIALAAEKNHLISNLLTIVITGSNLLKENLNDREKGNGLITMILSAADRIQKLLPNYKVIAGIESINLLPIDLGSELLNALAYVETMYSVRVVKEFNADDIKIMQAFGFPEVLQPMVDNIFSNVDKILSTNPDRAIRVRVEQRDVNNKLYYVLIFTDNGPGFAEETFRQIKAGKPVIESQYKGTGTGIPLAKYIMGLISPEIPEPYVIKNFKDGIKSDGTPDEFRGAQISIWFPAII